MVVRELLAPKGVSCDVENVLILSGGLEAMNLVCQAFIDPGDVILVEAPTFVQSRGDLRHVRGPVRQCGHG